MLSDPALGKEIRIFFNENRVPDRMALGKALSILT